MKAIDLNDRSFCASDTLLEELKTKMQPNDVVVGFAYTDYGGSFLDKVMIAYFEKNHPESIVSEYAGWNGENGLVFGDVAKRFIEETESYPLGFDDTENLYSQMSSEQETNDFQYFINENERDNTHFKPNAVNRLCDLKGGYYSMTTQGLDYSWASLLEFCFENKLCFKPKSRGILANH